jgi:hypothetical protein
MDTENNCEDYEVPEVDPAKLEDCDPETSDGDSLRLLAERVAVALSQRRDLLELAKRMLELLEDPNPEDESAHVLTNDLRSCIERCGS